ncbi:lysis system o-spanin lipoprotein Rz1 [Pseudomonas protegens]
MERSRRAETRNPPVWAMQEPSNSLQLLDELFSISAPGSLPIKQP